MAQCQDVMTLSTVVACRTLHTVVENLVAQPVAGKDSSASALRHLESHERVQLVTIYGAVVGGDQRWCMFMCA